MDRTHGGEFPAASFSRVQTVGAAQRDACLVLAPLNSCIEMTIEARRRRIAAGVVEVVPPGVSFILELPHAGCSSYMFDVEMRYLEAVLAEETGDNVSRPLKFLDDEPASSESGRSFVDLLAFVKGK